jgi:hypothetical protein
MKRLLLALCLLSTPALAANIAILGGSPPAPGGGTEILGYNSNGDTTNPATGGQITSNSLWAFGPYTVANTGHITSIHWWSGSASSGTVVWGVYAVSAGNPDALIGTCGTKVGSNTGAWTSLTCSGAGVAVTAGQSIALAPSVSGTGPALNYDTQSGPWGKTRAYTYTGSLPDPWGTVTTTGSNRIYGVYGVNEY